jgi:hypothetical protein
MFLNLSLFLSLGGTSAHTSGVSAKGPVVFWGYAAAVAAAGSGAMPPRITAAIC